MKKVIVCVRDNVAEVFHDPRTEVNTASAIRAFSDSVIDSPHKDDFALYLIGEHDTDNGSVLPCEPVRIFTGLDVKSPQGDLYKQD